MKTDTTENTIYDNIKDTAYYRYAEDVISGKQVAGILIKLACQRFMDDIQRDDLVFKYKKVNFAISFFKCFKHYTGKSAGQEFVLSPWQQFIVANIYGFYYKETGVRKYSSAYVEVSRKAGKSFLSAAMCLFGLIADHEASPEVYLAATSRDQASISFEMCCRLAKQLDSTGKELKLLRSEIRFNKVLGKLKVLASDSTKLDGMNASTYLIDEYHAHKTSEIRDVLKSSQGMRKQPLELIITTAGFLLEGPCKQLRDTGVQILNSVLEDDTSFFAIYEQDLEDDWTDESVWEKSNPNLDVTVTREFLRNQVIAAKNNPSDEVAILTKNFNMWCQSSETWIPNDLIINSMQDIPWDVFREEDSEVFIGSDLAAVGDLTAISYLTVKDNKFWFKTKYYLPDEQLKRGPNKELYKKWHHLGFIEVSPKSNVTDYDLITRDIVGNYNAGMQIKKIGYDPWNATMWCIQMTEQGMPMSPISQNMMALSPPTKMLNRLILSNQCVIDSNPITAWCFQNVVLKADWNDNQRPTKTNYSMKIDGVMSMIMSLQSYMSTPHYSNEIMLV